MGQIQEISALYVIIKIHNDLKLSYPNFEFLSVDDIPELPLLREFTFSD